MDFRHEWKHEINTADMLVLKSRLSAVMQYDSHYPDGTYEIRSLYFDDSRDTALREKLDGVNKREKFRIRLYNGDSSFICLEKKSKINGLCSKQSVIIDSDCASRLSKGNFEILKDSGDELLTEFYVKMRAGLAPKVLVDYTRTAFVFAPGNVRVTMDYNIRTGLKHTDILDGHCVTLPILNNPKILEVKWDGFLPDIIRDAVNTPFRRASAFSKYAACRMYD